MGLAGLRPVAKIPGRYELAAALPGEHKVTMCCAGDLESGVKEGNPSGQNESSAGLCIQSRLSKQ